MKNTYPIIISKGKKYFVVYVPDFDCNTQGKDLTEAIEMARDVIGLAGICREDDGEKMPKPTLIENVTKEFDNDIITLVDVDFKEYRRQQDERAVRRNVTLPSWLDYEAKKSGLNVSAVLQNALKQELHLSR